MPLEDAHALLMGIARYQRVTDLSEAVLHDVGDLAALLVDPQQGGYVSSQVHLVPEPEATLDRLRHELADLAERATAQSNGLIYFSGHGGRGTDGPGADLEINFPVAMYPAGLRNPEPVDPQGYQYDAFISYVDQDPDAAWVQQTLVPPLRAAGLRIALAGVSEDPGVPVVVGKERGVTQSKRTIVVLSDAYLRDNAAMFEELLAQDVGLYDGTWRLIPIRFAELSRANLLPARLRMLSTLDLGRPGRAETDLQRLVSALNGPVPSRTAAV